MADTQPAVTIDSDPVDLVDELSITLPATLDLENTGQTPAVYSARSAAVADLSTLPAGSGHVLRPGAARVGLPLVAGDLLYCWPGSPANPDGRVVVNGAPRVVVTVR